MVEDRKEDAAAEADFNLWIEDRPDPSVVGKPLTYTISFCNENDDSANNVVFLDALPDDMEMLSATPTRGTCDVSCSAGRQRCTVRCCLGSFGSGQDRAKIKLVTRLTRPGFHYNAAGVTFEGPAEINLTNNYAFAVTWVNPR